MIEGRKEKRGEDGKREEMRRYKEDQHWIEDGCAIYASIRSN